jgi:hypothetical protein
MNLNAITYKGACAHSSTSEPGDVVVDTNYSQEEVDRFVAERLDRKNEWRRDQHAFTVETETHKGRQERLEEVRVRDHIFQANRTDDWREGVSIQRCAAHARMMATEIADQHRRRRNEDNATS